MGLRKSAGSISTVTTSPCQTVITLPAASGSSTKPVAFPNGLIFWSLV